MGKTIICADSASIAMPELLGIAELSLDAFGWLECFSDAAEARRRCRSGEVTEAWVVGTDDITSLNLAAALLSDDPGIDVTVVEGNASGSFLSRAAQANVTRVISTDEFCALFYSEVRRRSLMDEVASIDMEHLVDASQVEDVPRVEEAKQSDRASRAEQASMPKGPGSSEVPAAQDELPRGDAFVIPVFGGSGGVGKSSFCAMGAYATVARGLKTAVIDLDLQFGDMFEICSEAKIVNIERLLDDGVDLDSLAASSVAAPVIIGRPENIEDSEIIEPSIMSMVNRCSNAFDVVIVNTQSHWNEHSVKMLEVSNCPVFLMDQRSSSVRSCIRINELCLRMGVATGSFLFALNGCSKGAMFSSIDVANAMQGVQVFELMDGSAEVEEVLGSGGALELFESDNPFVRSVKAMMDELLPSTGRKCTAFDAAEQPSTADGSATKRSALERRSRKSKKRHASKKEDSGADSLIGALFGRVDRVDSYLADEMRASK